MLELMHDQLRARLAKSGETVNEVVKTNAKFLCKCLTGQWHAGAREQTGFTSFRLILPSSLQGTLGTFQSQKAVACKGAAVSPEFIMVTGSLDSTIPHLPKVQTTKIGLSFHFALNSSRKTGQMFIQGTEDDEEMDMFARAFDSGLKIDTSGSGKSHLFLFI